MLNDLPKIIIILGPTATGKSELGVVLAAEFNGEIISADSRQVYKEMNIGTNKITKEEMHGVSHHLLDVASPRRNFNVARFQKYAVSAIKKIIKKNKLPIIVGGSPFYIYSVADGWVFPNSKKNSLLRKKLNRKSSSELIKILEEIDFDYAQKIDSSNPRRIIRAIEIAKKLGKVPDLKKQPLFNPVFIGLKLPIPLLHDKIKKRLRSRIRKGLIDEVAKLQKNGLSWTRLENFGLEYRWVAFYLQKKISREEMEKGIIKDSMKLVKNQMNWFKKDERIKWVNTTDEARTIIHNFMN